MELTQNQLTTQADPRVLIQIDSGLKRLSRELTQNQLTTQADPQVLIQIDSLLKRKTFDSESTHDSILNRIHAWLIQLQSLELSVGSCLGDQLPR